MSGSPAHTLQVLCPVKGVHVIEHVPLFPILIHHDPRTICKGELHASSSDCSAVARRGAGPTVAVVGTIAEAGFSRPLLYRRKSARFTALAIAA